MSPRPSRLLRSSALVTCAAVIAACGPAVAQAPETPVVTARMQTQAAAAEVGAPVVVIGQDGSRLVGAAALAGLEIYGADGRRQTVVEAGEAVAADVAYGFDLAGQPATVLAAVDTTLNALRFYRLADGTLTEVSARPVPLGFAAEGVCLYRHVLDGGLYAFVVGDGGEVDQQLLYATADGRIDARQVRRISVPSPLTQCVADSASAVVYAAEEEVGLWRFNADPEADVGAILVDLPGLGHIAGEVGGVALYDGGDGARWLIASDSSAGRLNVYDRGQGDIYVGSVAVAAGGAPLAEPGALFATSYGLPGGALVVSDEDGGDFKVLTFADVAAALSLSAGTPQDPRVLRAPPLPVVTPVAETVPVESFGDAADDPAIWAHPTDPALSLVIATDKKGGLYVYDMAGEVVQFLPVGKLNNVDLRDGFELGGEMVTLITASDRTNRAIAIFALDPATRQVTQVADGVQPAGLDDPYGMCMYRSAASGSTYVFINGDETRMRQWELVDAGAGRVRAEPVRDLTFDSQTEGCVADDATGVLYVGEEDVGLWRLGAEPDAGDDRTAVDTVAGNPNLVADVEGVSLYDLGDGRGYLIVSSQGNDSYAVYRREGDQAYLGSFAVIADPSLGIDGVSETDGLDVSSRNLGPGFEHGALVVQDGRNFLPTENQNYKYVPWQAIAEALDLELR